jgi:hypothetical protein
MEQFRASSSGGSCWTRDAPAQHAFAPTDLADRHGALAVEILQQLFRQQFPQLCRQQFRQLFRP